jgi:hypothetical protein
MKLAKSLLFGTVILVGAVGMAEAAPAVKTGLWSVDYYPNGAHAASFTRVICINADHTWGVVPSGGPLIPGSGGWAQDGGDFSLYGTIGEAIQGAANAAIGHTISAKFISGGYIDFNISTSFPNGSSGSFSAVYKKASCS